MRRLKLAGSWPNCNATAAKVNQSLENYRFDDAANTIYQFFWGSFCDWYLEIVKLRLDFSGVSGQGKDESAALNHAGAGLRSCAAAAVALHALHHRRTVARDLRRQAAGQIDCADAVTQAAEERS